MASPQTEYFFPHFPPPPSPSTTPPCPHTVLPPPPATKPPPSCLMPPPPSHFVPSPPPTTKPPPPATKPPPPATKPPPPAVRPPPPPPHTIPPPPPHTIAPPPPPHTIAPPPPPHTIPPPPPSAPGNHTIIVVVFISCGGAFFLAFVMAALWCFLKKKKMVRKAENVHIDEHKKVKEAIVQGPNGTETVVLSVEDDIHIEEDIMKSELKNFQKGLHLNDGDNITASSSSHPHGHNP